MSEVEMIPRIVVLIQCLMLAGCAGSSEFIRFDAGPRAHLAPNDRILVAIPKDGSHRGKSYPGSGVSAARSVRAAFAENTDRAGPLPDDRNPGEVYRKARQENYDYLVRPTILHWDDGTSEEASPPHRIEVKVDVVDIAADKVVASGLAIGSTDVKTSVPGQSEASLSLPFEDFVESLYNSER